MNVQRQPEQFPMSADMSFRNANPSEISAITNLINLAFRVERFFVESDRIKASEVRDRFGTGTFILAERGGLLIGCIYVELRGLRSYAGLLAVDPSQQRTGVGTGLMKAAEDHGRANGCKAMDLQLVSVREELPHFYRGLGYVETGVAPFPSSVPTKLACHFVTMAKPL
jgi:predicted N-acetyltransferase YhbS